VFIIDVACDGGGGGGETGAVGVGVAAATGTTGGQVETGEVLGERLGKGSIPDNSVAAVTGVVFIVVGAVNDFCWENVATSEEELVEEIVGRLKPSL
jgi:hypothetical protein